MRAAVQYINSPEGSEKKGTSEKGESSDGLETRSAEALAEDEASQEKEDEVETSDENQTTPKKDKKSLLEKLNSIGTVSNKEIVEFTRHISVMLNAGVTIFEAITFIRDQSTNKVFMDRLDHILNDLNNGHALSSALSRYPNLFPAIYINIVHVGEESGTLSQRR